MSHPFDAITVEQLRAAGSFKWATVPDTLGGFIAEMDFGIAPPIVSALHEAVDAMGFGYLTSGMQDVVRAACATYQAEHYGLAVDPAWVQTVPDVIQAFITTLEQLSPPGATVILPTPAYMPFLTVPATLDREVVQLPCRVDGDGRSVVDLDGLDRVLGETGAALVVLCNPHNPVGTVATADELAAFCAVIEEHPGARVFADEIHAPLVYAGEEHVAYATVSPAAAEHSVTATSASKAWNLPGLKCAQLILTSAADRAAWDEIGFMASHGTSNLGVVASAAAYREGDAWLDEVREYLDGNRRALADLLDEHLPEVRYRPPDGTYLAWLDCRALDLAGPATFFRTRAGVALVDGLACGAVGEGFVRLNFATPRPILEAMVEQMAAAVRQQTS